jgi:transposase
MEAPVIDDELWILTEPLLPPPKPRRKRHPVRVEDSLRWNHLPTRLGFGSGATCWRRLHAWQKARVWDRLHPVLLDKLPEVGQVDLSHAVSIPRRCEPLRRAKNWPKPHRSRTTPFEAPYPRLRKRRPPQRDLDRRKPQ